MLDTKEMADSTSSLAIEIMQNLSSFLSLDFEPVGKWFEQYTYLRHQGDAEEVDDESSSESEDEVEVEDTPEYLAYLQTLDPKNWKEQDHYKVLGIEKLRYKATQHQIKKAYKRSVLNHHPDKKKGKGSKDNNEYFTCITRAFETLSDPVKRCSFDSVDPLFDDHVPSASEKNKANFYKVFGPVFESNSRWSIKKKIPKFGDENSTFQEINDFYSFWYDFDSWREFSYLDEESKDSATDRDERRWIDKQNKAARLKLKKEEVSRIRQLVDNAYTCDPRILKLKQEEKKKKEDEKNKKREAIRLREEAEMKKIEEARLAKEKLEEEEKMKAEAEKAERQKQKKVLTKERKNLRNLVKDFNYFSDNPNDKVLNMEKIEALVDLLNLMEIKSLNESIQKSENQREMAKNLIFENLRIREMGNLEEEQIKATVLPVAEMTAAEVQPASKEWCDDEIRLLVKGVKIIPTGTRDRWDVVANFIEEHSRGKFKRTGKEVLTKTKDLQKLDPNVKEEANKKAFEKTLQTIKQDTRTADESKASERYATPGEQLLAEQGTNPAVWSADEQKILEQALKTYPASLADRWEKIAECLPTRSKKDCIVRYKELVELIQAKKRAQQKSHK